MKMSCLAKLAEAVSLTFIGRTLPSYIYNPIHITGQAQPTVVENLKSKIFFTQLDIRPTDGIAERP